MIKQPLSFDDLTIILPTLNEGQNIKDLLIPLTSYYNGASIIVGDEGSEDNTKEAVSGAGFSRVFFLDRKDAEYHGLTASVLDAVKLVKTRYFVVMDADGQHPWEKVEEILECLRIGNRLAVCSRSGVAGGWPWQRRLISYTGTILGKLSLGLRGKFYLNLDILSGFFGAEAMFWKQVSSDGLKSGSFRLGGYKVLFDFLKLLPGDLPVGQIYYVFNSRKKSGSKINFKIYFEYLRSLIT